MGAQEQRNILHVDDDAEFLRLVSRKLRGLGYQVISLRDSNLAVESIKINSCSVVLTDIDMPGTNGLDLLREIKQNDGSIQVIMLTGLVSMSTLLQSMRWGAEASVFKPIEDFEELTGHIDHAFKKIDHWWKALRELKTLKDQSTVV